MATTPADDAAIPRAVARPRPSRLAAAAAAMSSAPPAMTKAAVCSGTDQSAESTMAAIPASTTASATTRPPTARCAWPRTLPDRRPDVEGCGSHDDADGEAEVPGRVDGDDAEGGCQDSEAGQIGKVPQAAAFDGSCDREQDPDSGKDGDGGGDRLASPGDRRRVKGWDRPKDREGSQRQEHRHEAGSGARGGRAR